MPHWQSFTISLLKRCLWQPFYDLPYGTESSIETCSLQRPVFSLALSIAVLLLQRVTLSSLLIRIINEFLAFALLVYRSARDGIDWSEGWTVGRLSHTLVGVEDAFDCDKHFLQGLVWVPASCLHIYHSGAVNEVSWVSDLNLGHELDLGRLCWVVWSSDDVQRDETILKVTSKS